MKTLALFLSAIAVLVVMSNRAAADTFGFDCEGTEFEIEFVTIGDPGNPPDTTDNPNPAGSVNYVYRIGKYEISRGGHVATLPARDEIHGVH